MGTVDVAAQRRRPPEDDGDERPDDEGEDRPMDGLDEAAPDPDERLGADRVDGVEREGVDRVDGVEREGVDRVEGVASRLGVRRSRLPPDERVVLPEPTVPCGCRVAVRVASRPGSASSTRRGVICRRPADVPVPAGVRRPWLAAGVADVPASVDVRSRAAPPVPGVSPGRLTCRRVAVPVFCDPAVAPEPVAGVR